MEEKGVSIAVVVLLSVVLCVIVAVGGFKYGELNSEKEIIAEQEALANQYETIEIDKVLANEKIETMEYILGYVVGNYNDMFNDRINNGEFIRDKDEEFKYVWMYNVMLNKNIVLFNIDQNGKEVTGATSIGVNDFITSYKMALGVNYVFDQNDLPDGFVYSEANNRIYGATPTGWTMGNIIFKVDNLIKKDSLYTLTVNVLKVDYDEEGLEQDELERRLSDYEEISKYDCLDYDNYYVVHKLIISFVNNDGNYAVKSIVASE
ncbi:MAG: hypothetical protein IJ475_03760 [Bacilli bacterium]|nr:hypothetical protein [Bacilli bacterium]